jgi:hypothetical protein
MNLENALWLAGILFEAILVGQLAYRRVWQKLPAFFILVIWDLTCACVNFFIYQYFSKYYLNAYSIEIAVSSALEFSVLVELAWSVLRPIRHSLPKKSLLIIAFIILLAGAVLWPFSGVTTAPDIHQNLLVHIVQTVGFLRVGFFLLLALSSQWLSIGWRDRELQVATGLGFYSLISLLAAMLRAHDASLEQLHHFNQFVVGSYLCSLLYWAVSFAQKDAERREFTPQMQNLLLAVAGAARANRDLLGNSVITRSKDHRDL